MGAWGIGTFENDEASDASTTSSTSSGRERSPAAPSGSDPGDSTIWSVTRIAVLWRAGSALCS